MNIGLIDVDSAGFSNIVLKKRSGFHKGHNFPNLALMKLSAYHKQQGHSVQWYNGIEHYDRVYMSKVFSFTPHYLHYVNADEIVKGGTGYQMYDQTLPTHIEHICPDYTLYPQFAEAYGFTTRGCVNKCTFCVVPRKEGHIVPHADITEFVADKKEVVLMDNNIISCDLGLAQLEKTLSMNLKVDIKQGVDERIIAKDKQVAHLRQRLRYREWLKMAVDHSSLKTQVVTSICYLKEAGMGPSKMMFFVLAKDGEIEDAHDRVMMLDNMGCVPFVMPYRDLTTNKPPTREQKRLARWCNMRATFKSCKFEDYKY